ncbi:MAG: hypothetical protein ACC661_09330, partial [Verrucomicrobiales bacterium]
MPEQSQPARSAPAPVPERFLVSTRTLRFDRLMTRAIVVGGIGIVLAVFGIFAFTLIQVLPLFRGARLEPIAEASIGNRIPGIIGLDQWSEIPFSYFGGGEVHFTDLVRGRGTFAVNIPLPLEDGEQITAARYHSADQRILLGTSTGRAGSFTIHYQPTFDADDRRTIVPGIEVGEFYQVAPAGAEVREIAYGDSGASKLLAVIAEVDSRRELHAVTLAQKRSLLGAGKIKLEGAFDLSDQLGETPGGLLVPGDATGIVVSTEPGEIRYFFRQGDAFELRQSFSPFEDLPDP